MISHFWSRPTDLFLTYLQRVGTAGGVWRLTGGGREGNACVKFRGGIRESMCFSETKKK